MVYEAEQVSLGRRVALKVPPGHVASDRVALARFRREAKAAARLHHTNIAPVFEVGRDGEVAYYAMQFIQGQGLDQVIDELARLREPERKPGVGDSPVPTVGGRGDRRSRARAGLGRGDAPLRPGRDRGTWHFGDVLPAATERLTHDATQSADFVLSNSERAGHSAR